jgi:hypothetical protein
MLASCPASMLNQISLKLGIPFDSFLSHPALGLPSSTSHLGRNPNLAPVRVWLVKRTRKSGDAKALGALPNKRVALGNCAVSPVAY